jgi:hypothetical protein
LADDLADYVLRLVKQADFTLPAPPQIQFMTDLMLDVGQVNVEALADDSTGGGTTQVHQRISTETEILEAIRRLDAFLIVGGRRHVPLDRPLITVGRRADNDVVLEDGTISRKHAQIRWRYGRFVLYDLSNRGRTAVNDRPVVECVLQAGDVISISGKLLIYAEGDDAPPGAVRPTTRDEQTLVYPAVRE